MGSNLLVMHLNPAGLLTFFFLKTDPVGFISDLFYHPTVTSPRMSFFLKVSPDLLLLTVCELLSFKEHWVQTFIHFASNPDLEKLSMSFKLAPQWKVLSPLICICTSPYQQRVFCIMNTPSVISSNWDISCKGVFIDQNY